jgi:hypothetical protein|tara:strand:+ start:169 stop:555 length:387 start_codon:yes stop_codon:yes gene_type:complete
MNGEMTGGVPKSFWIIGAVMNFVTQMDAVAAMPEPLRATIENRPAWATVAFGVAVFAGTLGCVLFLLRKSVAPYLFIAALLGVIVQMPAHFGMADSLGKILLAILMPPAVSAFLVWYSKRAKGNAWVG